MTSFSDTFPDAEILDILGDDVEHIPVAGSPAILKCEFEFKYLEEELGDMVDIIYPVIELNTADAAAITIASSIIANGVVYRVFKKRPIAVGKTQVILER